MEKDDRIIIKKGRNIEVDKDDGQIVINQGFFVGLNNVINSCGCVSILLILLTTLSGGWGIVLKLAKIIFE